MNTKPLDLTKPIQTRDGRKVRILCTDGPDTEFPIVGFAEGAHLPKIWTSAGRYYAHADSDLDLINTPVKHSRTYWMNLYPNENHINYYFNTKRDADSFAAKDRIACKQITIEFEEGEGLA